jgi:magnesium transporter
MKFLASITIVMAIPTMVASFFGMNVHVPFENFPLGFAVVVGIALAASLAAVFILARKKMF